MEPSEFQPRPETGMSTETPFRIGDFFLAYGISLLVIFVVALGTSFISFVPGEFTFWLPLQVLSYVIGLLVVKRWRRANLEAFGFPILTQYWWGLLTGPPILFTITILMLPISSRLSENNNLVTESILAVEGAAEIIMAVLGVVILIPLTEELLFRGLLQPAIARRFGSEAGIVASSVLFGLIHVFNIDPEGSQLLLQATATAGVIFLLALLLAWVRDKTNSISLSFFIHAGWNGLLLLILLFAPEVA